MIGMEKPIKIVKLQRAQARDGYKVLPSWRRPPEPVFAQKVDLWIPELAPSLWVMKNYRQGKMAWEEFVFLYGSELKSPLARAFLKPLALLSIRRKLVLLCDCAEENKCPGLILASALEDCRNKRDFILTAESCKPYL